MMHLFANVGRSGRLVMFALVAFAAAATLAGCDLGIPITEL
jgi:hypothetical protein